MSIKEIQKIEKFEKTLFMPADKSILHRAILLGGIADGKTKVFAKLGGADNLTTLQIMQKLGAKVDLKENCICIEGCSQLHSHLILDCQNSGTTMRLLAGLLSSKNIYATLIGDSSLQKRPMRRVTDLLEKVGAKVKTDSNGFAPIQIEPSGQVYGKILGGRVQVELASAQIKSALLLAALNGQDKTTVIQNVQTRNHTELMLKTFGANIKVENSTIEVEPSVLRGQSLQVAGDCSSAAFFLALAALKGRVTCKNISINPTRSYYLNIMQRMGVAMQIENKQYYGNELVADITVERSILSSTRIMSDEVPYIIDELPILAILMAFADGKSEVLGAGELKVKESNRLQAIVDSINAIGGRAKVVEDGFVIEGKKTLQGGTIDSLHDHRIAMSAAIALACSQNGGRIHHAECVDISLPNFYAMLES